MVFNLLHLRYSSYGKKRIYTLCVVFQTYFLFCVDSCELWITFLIFYNKNFDFRIKNVKYFKICLLIDLFEQMYFAIVSMKSYVVFTIALTVVSDLRVWRFIWFLLPLSCGGLKSHQCVIDLNNTTKKYNRTHTYL